MNYFMIFLKSGSLPLNGGYLILGSNQVGDLRIDLW